MLSLSFALLLAAGPIDRDGVTFERTLEVKGKTLTLNGVGTRRVFGLSLYVMGLWLEQPSKDADALLKQKQVRQVVLTMRQDIEKAIMVEAYKHAIRNNVGEAYPKWEPRLKPFFDALHDLKRGDRVSITCTPGKGVHVGGTGIDKQVPGDDVGVVILGIWLGEHPVDANLKADLLGPVEG